MNTANIVNFLTAYPWDWKEAEKELFETLLLLGFNRLEAERLAAGEVLHHWED